MCIYKKENYTFYHLLVLIVQALLSLRLNSVVCQISEKYYCFIKYKVPILRKSNDNSRIYYKRVDKDLFVIK